MKTIILSDFDGTIVLSDLAAQALDLFVTEDWLIFDKMYLNNEISLDETIIKQYSLIKVSKEQIITTIDPTIQIRENFYDFISFCKKKNVEFIVVSAGLDFIIEHVLKAKLGLNDISVKAFETSYKNGSLSIKALQKYFKDSSDFKNDIVRYYKSIGYFVVFIGDGPSDFGAANVSDKIYAVKNSILSSFCKDKKLNVIEFETFSEIQKDIF